MAVVGFFYKMQIGFIKFSQYSWLKSCLNMWSKLFLQYWLYNHHIFRWIIIIIYVLAIIVIIDIIFPMFNEFGHFYSFTNCARMLATLVMSIPAQGRSRRSCFFLKISQKKSHFCYKNRQAKIQGGLPLEWKLACLEIEYATCWFFIQ